MFVNVFVLQMQVLNLRIWWFATLIFKTVLFFWMGFYYNRTHYTGSKLLDFKQFLLCKLLPIGYITFINISSKRHFLCCCQSMLSQTPNRRSSFLRRVIWNNLSLQKILCGLSLIITFFGMHHCLVDCLLKIACLLKLWSHFIFVVDL